VVTDQIRRPPLSDAPFTLEVISSKGVGMWTRIRLFARIAFAALKLAIALGLIA